MLPALAFAQRPNFTYTNDFVDQLMIWAQKAVTFLMVVATLYFIWTVISYIRAKGEAKEVDPKKHAMIRGVIGLFVIVAIWGIVRVISSTLGVAGTTGVQAPCPPGMTYVGGICQ